MNAKPDMPLEQYMNEVLLKELVAMLNSPDSESKKPIIEAATTERYAKTESYPDETFDAVSVESMCGDAPETADEVELTRKAEEFKRTTEASREKVLNFSDFYNAKRERERFTSPEEKKPVTAEEAYKAFEPAPVESSTADFGEFEKVFTQLFNAGMFPTPESKKVKEYKKTEATKPPKPEHKVAYQKDTASVCGKSVSFKRVETSVDWYKSFDSDDVFNNLIKLKKHITSDTLHQFGDWSRIRTIYIFNEQLIINGICYVPKLPSKDVERNFPLDTVDYIKNGTIASLFDWSRLRKMTNLTEFHIDSCSFYVTYICDDLGWHKDATALFKICSGLKILSVEGQLLGEGSETTESVAKHKKKVSLSQYFRMLPNGYKIDVCKGTQSFQGFAFNNLKTYATNRGDKNFFQYAIGTTARFGFAGVAGALNLGTHLVGGTFKAIKSALKDAVTPVDKADL